MKSFFQRFHDSQPGASKSRAKDAVYRQRIPSFQMDRDHSQLDNSVKHETDTHSKQRAPKSAGVQIPSSGVHSHVSQFSAVPVSSTSGVTLPPLPLSQSHPLSKAANPKPLNDSKEKAGSSSKRNEVRDLFGNENNVVSRTKSERPGRSRQTSTAPVSQKSATNAQVGTENRRNKERLTQVDESDSCGTWPLRRYDNLDGKEKRLRKGGPEQQFNTDKLQWVQSKDEERRDHYQGEILGRVRGRVVNDVQRWEHQEGRKEESKEKEKQNNGTREKKRYRDEDRNEPKEKERVREREREREKDFEREGERNKEKEKRLREKVPTNMKAKQLLSLREQAYREAKEQQKKERRGDELGNQERGERKARERQAEGDHREQLELQRKEREHRAAAEQRERERRQQEIWEREQDEREHKERERLNRVRRREERWRKEVCQQESDHKKEDLFKLECERQEQRNSKQERGEEESERKCGDRERHWRGGRHREISEAALTNTGTNDKGTTHPSQRVSDSEREMNETERRRLSPSATQTNTPFELEERIYSYGEAACSAKVMIKSRKSELHDPPGRTDTSIHCHEDLQQLSQEGWYASKVAACRKDRPSCIDGKISQQNVAGRLQKDLHGHGANPLRPRLLSIQESRSSPSAHTQLLVEPVDNSAFATSTRLVECSVSIVPPTYKTRVTSSDAHTSTLEDSSHVNRLLEEGPRKIRTSVPDVQPSSQQSSLDAINLLKTTRPSFPANPTSIDHQLQGNQPAVSNSNAFIAAIERPHDNLFPSTVTQSLPSHTLPNKDTISSKDTRISEPTEVHAQSIVEPSEVKTHFVQELLEYPSSVLNPSLNPLISQNLISGQGQKHHLGAPITDPTRSHVQNSSLTQHNLYDTPLPQSSVSNSTPPTDPPAEEQMIAPKQEIGPQESRQKEVYAQRLSQNLPLNPLSPVAVPLCSVIADKQSNIEPSKNESRQDLIASQISTNPSQPSCLSPSHVYSKIYDGTLGYNDKILPHHSNKDSIQIYADRTPLQETAPSLSRQETSDKFDRQENQIRTPTDQIQPGRIQPSDTLGARRHHQRDHVSARAAPPIENLPLRHRRYHSDTETAYQGNNPFPRSHLAESSHFLDSRLTRPGRSKHKPNTKETELESPRVDLGNIAFRTPVPGILESTTATYGKHSATVPLPGKPITFQETSEHGSYKRKHDARGLSVLVSHNKQPEGTARHGGQIAMTGTTILGSRIQSDVPSPPARVIVSPPLYPQSLAAPEVDQLSTIVGIRSPVSGALLLQSRDVPDISQGQSSMAQPQATYLSNAQFDHDVVVRKDNTKNSARESGVDNPAQPRPRKQSSPQIRPRDDQSKLSSSKGGNIDDDQTSRPRQAHGHSRGTASCADVCCTQKTEITRTEDVHMTDHQLGLCPSTYVQLPSTDDKSYDSGNHPSQLTPPPNPAPISPQRTNTLDAEFDAGSQKDSTQIKNSRLAELLSPPKPSDIPLHSYSSGARRHLAYDLPNLAHAHSGNEESSRPRGTSSREEHASRHGLTEDSSPFGNIHSFPSNPQPDLSIKESGYSWSSPDADHITPSFRARDLVAGNHTFQSGSVPPRELSRSVSTGYPHRQSSARERQDMISDTEKVLLPKYNHDAELRIGERSKSSHVAVPVSNLQTGKKISQKDIARKNAEEPSQPVASTHTRARSDPHITPDSTVLRSRNAYNESCNAISTQPQILPASAISPSEPTVPILSQLSDQSQNSQSYSSNLQSPTVRDEVPVPPPSTEVSSMKSALSRKNHITPLFPGASNHGSLNSQSSSSQTYEIWLPSTSSRHNEVPSRSIPISGIRRDLERARDRAGQSARCLPYQPYTIDPLLANAYHYIKTRKMRTMSTASLEAQDGAASTVVGSPTTSILSQTPINIPPEQDPILAARKWTEAGAICPGQRIRRPGLVWELPEDPPPIYQQEHRRPEPRSRRSRLSNSRTRETGDTD